MDYLNTSTWHQQLNRLEGAYAPSTIRAYYADAQQFVDWCARKNCNPFPLTDVLLADYVSDVGGVIAFSSLRRRLVAVRRLNSLLGHAAPEQGEEFRLTLRRVRRAAQTPRRQAFGINRGLLLRAIDAQPKDLTGARNRALLSLGYDFLARRSELCALRQDDLEFQSDGTIHAVIRRGKADPYGRGRLVFGSERSAKLARAWLRQKPKEITHLFCSTRRGVCLDRPLTGRTVGEIIKKAIVRTRGERPRESDVSGHSLRVGAAQDLLTEGWDIAAIMRAGGWSSLAVVSEYLRLAEHNPWRECAHPEKPIARSTRGF